MANLNNVHKKVILIKSLIDSKSFLSQNTGNGICHEVNISELGVMFEISKLYFCMYFSKYLLFQMSISVKRNTSVQTSLHSVSTMLRGVPYLRSQSANVRFLSFQNRCSAAFCPSDFLNFFVIF